MNEYAQIPNTNVDSYIQELKSADAITRQKAILGLAQMGQKAQAAIPNLLQALQDSDQGVRVNAAIVIGDVSKTATPAVVAALTNAALRDNSDGVRLNAIGSLERLQPVSSDTVTVLARVLQSDKNQRVRHTAATILGHLGSNAQIAVPSLIGALQNGDNRLKALAAYALGQIGPVAKSSVPTLIQFLQAQDVKVRQEATRALQQITRPK
jgi:HEAT repeat protein